MEFKSKLFYLGIGGANIPSQIEEWLNGLIYTEDATEGGGNRVTVYPKIVGYAATEMWVIVTVTIETHAHRTTH